MSLVVDSSVALKWFVKEPGHEAALELLDGSDPLIAPDLILAEVGNALWRKARNGEVEADQISRSISELADIVILRPLTVDLMLMAVEIMRGIGHSIYDCVFLAAARREKVDFVTADAKLLAKLVGRPDWNTVRRLEI